MQIDLVAPANEDSANVPRLGLAILAALTPREDEIWLRDDGWIPFDLEHDTKPIDWVAITVDSKTARRAYDIADAYRRQGATVVLGGIHPTFLPLNLMQHRLATRKIAGGVARFRSG